MAMQKETCCICWPLEISKSLYLTVCMLQMDSLKVLGLQRPESQAMRMSSKIVWFTRHSWIYYLHN